MLRNAMLDLPQETGGSLGTEARQKQAAFPPAQASPIRHAPAPKYNENRAFRHKTATAAGYNRLLFQVVTHQIRCSWDQRNFRRDQRIRDTLTTE
jgi:hypothetical protein